jgi:hypothetical protein
MPETKPDPLAGVIAEVVTDLLEAGDTVKPIDVLLALEVLDTDQVDAWRRGGVPYLERGITAGLARVARVLRLVREEALKRGLEPVPGKYRRSGKGPPRPLRFSKRGDDASEKAYGTHFVRRSG